jgi:hypothetical protein
MIGRTGRTEKTNVHGLFGPLLSEEHSNTPHRGLGPRMLLKDAYTAGHAPTYSDWDKITQFTYTTDAAKVYGTRVETFRVESLFF